MISKRKKEAIIDELIVKELDVDNLKKFINKENIEEEIEVKESNIKEVKI